jgi:2-iminobutanoate/2-iminopropanoate deaminase
MEMKKEIRTEWAPLPIGPYSQGIVCSAGELVFTAGQIAIPPGGSEISEKKVDEQTRCALENIRAILAESDCGMEHVVKVTIFLRDRGDYAMTNKVYETFFSVPPFPTRSVVEVSNLPKDALVEIEAVAIRGKK